MLMVWEIKYNYGVNYLQTESWNQGYFNKNLMDFFPVYVYRIGKVDSKFYRQFQKNKKYQCFWKQMGINSSRWYKDLL